MNEFKGTPGPWMVKKDYYEWTVRQKGSTKRHPTGFQTYRQICECIGKKADAQLIASAPALLKALADLLESYESVMHSEFDYPGDLWSAEGRDDAEAIAAHAAIAKALGK